MNTLEAARAAFERDKAAKVQALQDAHARLVAEQQQLEHIRDTELPVRFAWHEAAHIAVALSQGVPVSAAAICVDDGFRGFMRHTAIDYPETLALIALAGPMMDRRRGGPWDADCEGDLRAVDEAIARMLPNATAEERAQRRKIYETLTNERLDQLMPAITRIAEALLERRSLDAAQIKALYEQEAA